MTKLLALAGTSLLLAGAAQADPSLTIYNQNFGVIRDNLPLNLVAGVNNVEASDVTAQLEPDSVVLRDPTGQRPLRIMEQFYRADPISQAYLLSLYEGKTIDFRVRRGDKDEIVQGKIIRSGFQTVTAARGYPYDDGSPLANGQPVVEVNGQLRFSLPGEPLFPALPGDAILKPTLNWVLRTPTAGPLNAELAYVSRGLNWEADYNVVAPSADDSAAPNGEKLEVNGLVTLTNNSGKTFENAAVKLMAGDVNKIQPAVGVYYRARAAAAISEEDEDNPQVKQKAFEDYHLYSLPDRTTVRDRETKQVEFLRANGVKCNSLYVYDGADIDSNRYSGYDPDTIRQDRGYGTKSNRKVLVMRSFENTKANGLGVPLPKGRVRFYRRDTDGQLEFTGENTIDHTPDGETVRINTGSAFDLTGDRKQTNYKIDSDKQFVIESFQITLRNRKKQPVDIRVVEHMYRGANWTMTEQSAVSLKRDANTAEFSVRVPPEGEKVVTYTVRYTW